MAKKKAARTGMDLLWILSPFPTFVASSIIVTYNSSMILVYFCKRHIAKIDHYGNGNSNGIIEVSGFFCGNIEDTIFLELVSSSNSMSC